jgi:hypothetical protein
LLSARYIEARRLHLQIPKIKKPACAGLLT